MDAQLVLHFRRWLIGSQSPPLKSQRVETWSMVKGAELVYLVWLDEAVRRLP
jgi:hypothetical protein